MEALTFTIGHFRVRELLFGMFRLDGGAMFGSVPRPLWSKQIPPDERGRIPLATRSIVVEVGDRVFLVDVGIGEKMGEKERNIYAIENKPNPDQLVAPTDIILTHLHFDHAGGISRWSEADPSIIEPTWPQATIHIQHANVTTATTPNIKERASYFRENVETLSLAKTVLYHGTQEVYPGIFVHRVDGHTDGMQWVEVRSEGKMLLFPSDLIPTSSHLHPAYTMGYDMCAAKVLSEKLAFLSYAAAHEAIVVFQHDPMCPALRIIERGGKFEGVSV